jgi:hypothetical protein
MDHDGEDVTKLSVLFEWVTTHDATVIRIEDNSLPISGYAVPFDSESIMIDDFDLDVARMVRKAGAIDAAYLVFYDGKVAPCEVFALREYAMGYAAGSGVDFILDLSANKRIVRKQ